MRGLRLFGSQVLGLGGVIAAFTLAIAVGTKSANTLPTPTPTGMVVKQSPHSVAETTERFISTAEARGITVMATVDHAQNASGVDLSLRPTRVVLFGNPRLGTPLMQCEQSIAIDLPQKMLIWEDETGQVSIAYNDPRYLGGRHRLSGCGSEVIERIAGALDGLSGSAIAP